MKFLSSSLVTLVLLLTRTASAYLPEAGKVTATLGPFVYKTNFTDTQYGVRAPFKGDVALIVNGDVNNHGSLEIGLFHLQKEYVRDQSERYLAEEVQTMQVALGYRYWLGPRVSTAAALVSDYSLGEPKILHNDFPPDQNFQTSAHDIVKYALGISLQGDIWSERTYSILFDARYNYSFTEKSHERGDLYGVMIGVKFLVQEKYPDPAP